MPRSTRRFLPAGSLQLGRWAAGADGRDPPGSCHWGRGSGRPRRFQPGQSRHPTVPSRTKCYEWLRAGRHRGESVIVSPCAHETCRSEALTAFCLAAICGLTGSSNWYRHLVRVPAPNRDRCLSLPLVLQGSIDHRELEKVQYRSSASSNAPVETGFRNPAVCFCCWTARHSTVETIVLPTSVLAP